MFDLYVNFFVLYVDFCVLYVELHVVFYVEIYYPLRRILSLYANILTFHVPCRIKISFYVRCILSIFDHLRICSLRNVAYVVTLYVKRSM